MKTQSPDFSRRYLTALRRHLKQGSSASLDSAHRLGVKAVALKLETLQLARLHEEALITLVLPHYSARTSDGMIRRAGAFFAEAIRPIEETHRGALEANVKLTAMIESLRQRTAELATSNAVLKQEVVQRLAVENSLRSSETTTSQLLQKSRRQQEELRELSRRLLSAQEKERQKISRELHDVIAQTLTGINVRLAALKIQGKTKTTDLQNKITMTQRLVEKSVDIVHRFARNLRPTVLDDLGLIPALQSYLQGFMAQTGVRVSFTAFAGVESLNSEVLTVLYRIVQEALTNVARHAHASRAKVGILQHDGSVSVEITDNGVGFQTETVALAKRRKRLGLLGMRERAEMIGGTFTVISAPGKGTTVRVEIPQRRIAKKQSAVKNKPTPTTQRS